MSGLMILGSVPLYNIFAVLILVLEQPGGQQERLGPKLQKSLRKIAANPIILGILAGLAVSLLRIPLPQMLTSSLGYLGKLTTPLALLAIKLLILPAIFLPIAAWLASREKNWLRCS